MILYLKATTHLLGRQEILIWFLSLRALTPEFGEKLWEFIQIGRYRNKATNGQKPQFYRFDKPEDDTYPKMIELFAGMILNSVR